MGSWGKNRGGKGGKGNKGKHAKQQMSEDKEELTYLKAVDPRWALNKAALRAYASTTGSPFYAAQSQSDADFLSLGNMLQKMEPYTSELANRLGIALSEAGGTISMGKLLLEKYAEDPTQTGEKLGIQGLAALFQTDAGKAFVEAAAVFNKHDSSAAKTSAALQAAAAFDPKLQQSSRFHQWDGSDRGWVRSGVEVRPCRDQDRQKPGGVSGNRICGRTRVRHSVSVQAGLCEHHSQAAGRPARAYHDLAGYQRCQSSRLRRHQSS